NPGLSLGGHGRTLAVTWRGGRPYLDITLATWRVSQPRSGSGFPWAWVGGGIGGGLVLLAAGGLFLWRRRGEELEEHAREELGSPFPCGVACQSSRIRSSAPSGAQSSRSTAIAASRSPSASAAP